MKNHTEILRAFDQHARKYGFHVTYDHLQRFYTLYDRPELLGAHTVNDEVFYTRSIDKLTRVLCMLYKYGRPAILRHRQLIKKAEP